MFDSCLVSGFGDNRGELESKENTLLLYDADTIGILKTYLHLLMLKIVASLIGLCMFTLTGIRLVNLST